MSFLRHICQVLTVVLSLSTASASFHDELKALETASGGKIGVAALNTATQERVGYRENERFLLGSTFKTIGVAAMLKQSTTDPALMQTTLQIEPQDLSSWAPITSKHVNQTMSVLDLCAAAMSYSDNTAIQLVMEQLGGTQKVVEFSRTLNDQAFTMNPPPGELRPTSTPLAMANSLHALTLGDALAPAQRDQLLAWMKANTTGDQRIRAGVPKGWVVADKTGSSEQNGITNDIAVIYPPNGAPIILTVYYAHPDQNAPRRPDIVAKATRIVLNNWE